MKKMVGIMLLLCSIMPFMACTSTEDEPYKPETEQPSDDPNNNEEEDNDTTPVYGHLTTANTVSDVVNHEAFNGFGRFILPAERSYNDNMTLQNVASMLPYHNYITGERAVETINTMIDYVHDGNTLFYDIYSDADKQADSRKNNTGVFFFRGEPGKPFAIVCPGGGFSYVGAIHEGFPLAIALSKMGYNAFPSNIARAGRRSLAKTLPGPSTLLCAMPKSCRYRPTTIRSGAVLRGHVWQLISALTGRRGSSVRYIRVRQRS